MKFSDINKVYTQYVSEYIAQGYTINAGTMNGSQGEIAHVDLTDGKEIIRVLMSEECDYESNGIRYIRIVAGKATDKIKPNDERDYWTIWNQKLETIKETKFWVVGDGRKERFFGTKEEAIEAEKKRLERWKKNSDARESNKRLAMTPELEKLAKSYLRKKTRKSRIYSDAIMVYRRNGKHCIAYQGYEYILR